MTGDLMMESTLAKMRTVLIRGLAVVAVVGTYAIGTVATQVAAGVGISTLALTTSTTPAKAGYGGWWGRGRFRHRAFAFAPRRRFFHRRWWGGY